MRRQVRAKGGRDEVDSRRHGASRPGFRPPPTSSLREEALSQDAETTDSSSGLLRSCAGQFGWTLAEQFSLKRGGRTLRLDGALLDSFRLLHGVWEAKESGAHLDRQARQKFEAGYPRDNIIFQAPDRAIIWTG